MASITVRAAAAVGALVIGTTLAACGGSSTDAHAGHTTTTAQDSEVAKHNADDVMFLQNMIPHHQQAVDMGTMVPSHTNNPDLLTLASEIQRDQLGEITAFQGYLTQWDQPTQADHMGHADMGISGMVDPNTMNRLQSLHGADFDKLWMQSMIGHHQGALAMAQQEITHGQNRDTISMARLIITTQQREIDYMKHLLGQARQ
ncbi:DUF305 domain-containing protein [Mycobacterium sp.]|uniref:DUF305 domain-containing protein n=1 Tax=Mycobacterium sp. TaxID=1785 RepID=UPI002D53EA17|nr:DUF305 domain-containing protein [Mycobacterium sp.]HZA11298.1 DUF305 domain-containing protein [Mycobacterium sp.]